jgi:hypothetical protein
MPYAAKNLPHEQRRQIERMLLQGLSCRQIARELSIHPTLVSAVRQGIANLSPAEARRRVQGGGEPAQETAIVPATQQPATALSVRPKRDKARAALREYQRLLRRKLPLKDRATALAQLAKKWKTQPAVAMKALEQIDKIEGFTQQVKDAGGPPLPAAMFVLPPGSTSAVAIRVQTQEPLPPEPQSEPDPAA